MEEVATPVKYQVLYVFPVALFAEAVALVKRVIRQLSGLPPRKEYNPDRGRA